MQTLTYEELARRRGRVGKYGKPVSIGSGAILGRAMEHIDSVAAHMDALPPYLYNHCGSKERPA
jgi:hypothetical protein